MADMEMRMGADEAKAILRETMDSLYLPSSGFSSALQEAANDMIKYMRLVFPLVAKHQMMVLAQHGFTAQGEDLLRFTRLVKEYERHDEELAQLNSEIRRLAIPHMDVIRTNHSRAI